MPDPIKQPEQKDHSTIRELILMLYMSGGMFWIIALGLIGLPALGLVLDSKLLAVALPLLHLALCISLIVWAFKKHNKDRL